ncbi:MAG: hypothetical protein ABH873_07955 [Candidatus Firestonebacteria bacterium]
MLENEIQIRPEFIKKAKEYADASLNHTFDRFKYDDETRHKKIFIGKIGEHCIIFFLRKEGINVIEDKTTAEEMDAYDLKVGDKTIDVKTCEGKSNYIRLFVVKDKFDTYKKHDFYIGIKLNEELTLATIHGFATKEDIEKAPIQNFGFKDNHWLYLKDLRPITELLKLLL